MSYTAKANRSIFTMSITSDNATWSADSEYHVQREAHSRQQVDTYLAPYLLQLKMLSRPVVLADLACGVGSIAEAVVGLCVSKKINIDRFILIDVVEDNLQQSVNRLSAAFPGLYIETRLVNGSAFPDLDPFKSDFLYCWDAMVHFDVLDVAGYLSTLKSACRGKALFHHSNLSKVTYNIMLNPHCRNHMTKDMFAQFSISSGLEVKSQELIDWGSEIDLDCITVVSVQQ